MTLIEKEIEIGTRAGNMPGFSAVPADGTPVPPIIFYMDAPGYREELRNMARRIAKAGYFCVVPDMYYRIGVLRFDLLNRNDAMTKVIFAAMNHLTNAMVVEDTACILSWLDGQAEAKSGAVGCVGHCMSGRYITTVSAKFPSRIKAAGSLYGVGIITEAEDSPHLLLNDITAELYYAFAQIDEHVPDHVVPELKEALSRASVKHTVELFEGTQHGFCFPERHAYSPEAAEATWARLFDMWERQLK
tara:strand:+ start:341 stop:1078 length:738 start_codon:yes stop_codon:yes gene_type:complete